MHKLKTVEHPKKKKNQENKETRNRLGENVFKRCIYEGLTSKVYKEQVHLNNKKRNNPNNKGAKSSNNFHQRRYENEH